MAKCPELRSLLPQALLAADDSLPVFTGHVTIMEFPNRPRLGGILLEDVCAKPIHVVPDKRALRGKHNENTHHQSRKPRRRTAAGKGFPECSGQNRRAKAEPRQARVNPVLRHELGNQIEHPEKHGRGEKKQTNPEQPGPAVP
jgi:hypothetical protein